MSGTHPRICVIGAGTRFLSGISYYTLHLINALAPCYPVSAILMRQLLPTRFYPGRQRVGKALTRLQYAPHAHIFDGVDWYGIPSLLQAIRFLRDQRPEVVILQWWTGSVLHSYLLLALAARCLGAKIIIEFHEVLDTGEARMAAVQMYVKTMLPWLIGLASGVVVHSEFDRVALEKQYGIAKHGFAKHAQALIPLGPFEHHSAAKVVKTNPLIPQDCCHLLYFGVIRPYKGVEDLIRAFDSIPEDQINRYWLTVVGETWEGWTLPGELIAHSRYKDRITFINRYVHDDEVDVFFAGADAVVLPYHRSSASGPLHMTMSLGLPVIVTSVGGLTEAAGNYQGAIFVPPHNPEAICQAFARVFDLRGQHFAEPYTWDNTLTRYQELFAQINQTSQEKGAHYARVG
jgi:glycosyltransferase involved in cell wall biosynthesis